MTLVDWIVVLLVVVPAFPALTALILLRHWNRLDSPSLHERTLLAIRDWAVASIAASLALARLGFIHLPNGTALPMLAIAMLLVSLPSAYWLFLYFRGRFR
jgi:hypothetical protein